MLGPTWPRYKQSVIATFVWVGLTPIRLGVDNSLEKQFQLNAQDLSRENSILSNV